jgi:hypothetical protein
VKLDAARCRGGKNDKSTDKLQLHRSTRTSGPDDSPCGEVLLSLRQGCFLEVDGISATLSDALRAPNNPNGMRSRGSQVGGEARVSIESHGSGAEDTTFFIHQFEG